MDEGRGKKFTADFKVLMVDVEDLVKATASHAGDRIGDLRQRLEKEIADARKALPESLWFQKARKTKSGTESCLRENIWTGLLVATGIGALLGWLIRRR